MCGIVGITARDAALVKRMATTIAHRGPDAEGVWLSDDVELGLGHRRLSILDLHARGDQPMQFAQRGRQLVITFNGEIYNFHTLRAELESAGYTFATGTDTEVILAAYAAWGSACVARFNGMWAFAIWDVQARTLFLSRDRFGKKPLYYVQHAGRFAFASEIKALLVIPGVARRANRRAAGDYLLRGLVNHTAETFFEGIYTLPAGHNAHYALDTAKLTFAPYYVPHAVERAVSDEELAAALRRAVIRRTVSDVPISISLSGGVDSSSIAALLAAESKTPIAAFTTSTTEGGRGDETALVDMFVARYPQYQLHKHAFDAAGFLRDHEKLVYHAEEPLWGDGQYVRWEIASAVRAAGFKVMLTGEGADELLAGYWPASAFHLRDSWRAGQRTRWLRELAGLLRQPDKHLIAGALLVLLCRTETPANFGVDRLAKQLGVTLTPHAPSLLEPLLEGSLKDCLLQMVKVYSLPQLVMCNDKMSMAHSIESRAPFLDVEFAETALAIPSHALIHDGMRKYPLRRAMRAYVPDAILSRRKKDSFASPMASFLDDPSIRAKFQAYFADPRIAPVIDTTRVQRHFARHGIDAFLTRLFWLECWSRVFDAHWGA